MLKLTALPSLPDLVVSVLALHSSVSFCTTHKVLSVSIYLFYSMSLIYPIGKTFIKPLPHVKSTLSGSRDWISFHLITSLVYLFIAHIYVISDHKLSVCLCRLGMCLHEVPHDAKPLGPMQRPEGIAMPILPLAPETLDQGASTELITPNWTERQYCTL